MLIIFGPWKTPGITKSRGSSLDLRGWKNKSYFIWTSLNWQDNFIKEKECWKKNLWKFHDGLIAAIRIKRENIKREINLRLLFNLISSFQDLKTYKICNDYHLHRCNNHIIIIELQKQQREVNKLVTPHGQLQQHVVG